MRFSLAATLLVLPMAISGCSTSGKDAADSYLKPVAVVETPNTALTDTMAALDDAEGSERDRLLDEDVIRNAVTSVDPGAIEGGTIPWANQATGSHGEISNVSQAKVQGQTCRNFNATRVAYNGISLYEGELCLDRRSGWWTRVLKPFDRLRGADEAAS